MLLLPLLLLPAALRCPSHWLRDAGAGAAWGGQGATEWEGVAGGGGGSARLNCRSS